MTEEAKNEETVVTEAVVSQEAETPPEAIGEPVQDQSIIGELEQNEVALLNALAQKQRALTFQIGDMEVRKAMTLGQMQGIDNQVRTVYQNVAVRLGIGDNVQWNITPDFKVRVLPVTGMAS